MSSLTTNTASKNQKLAPVKVYLRIRPKHNGDGIVAIENCTPKEICLKGHPKGFTFDQIFDHNTSQVKVYKTVVGEMISDVTKGYNCTIFAYGQTGTGKTFTITGGDCIKDNDNILNWQEDSNEGIILRAAVHLFEELNNLIPKIQSTVAVSFMEIYNEEIRDLLCDKESAPLRIYEDKMKSVHVKNLQEVTVMNSMEIIQLLKRGCERRQVASTLMNKHSSRSHTVFTISVSTMETISHAENISNITFGKLNLIDLAGSENISKSGSKEHRAREAANINQSLLTLGRVMKALVEHSSHIPYRESKLTRILQESLGGKSKTSIIATISPGMASIEETMNTLEYAHNARNITNCPTINLRTSDTAAAVQEELQRLKRDLFAMANEQGVYMDKENYNEMKQSLTEFKKQITSKHETIKSLTDQVQNLEAQRQEWEHLKESFKKSSHAWQMMKSEIEKKEVELLRDGALLQHYKDEFEKLKEIAELLFTRENHLHTKLDHVFQSSRKNQHVLENIIQMVTSTIDDLFLPQNSQNFSKNVLALTQFNNKVHHMINNVVKKLEEESGRNDTNPENKICDSQNKNILTELYESSEFFSSEFQKFQEKCSSKILEIHEFIEKSDRYVSECKNAYHMEENEKLQIQALLNMDCENKKTFLEKSKSIVHEQTSSIRKYIEEQKKAIQLEKQQIQEMENALSRDLLLELTEYGENRKRIFEIISKFPCLEQNVNEQLEQIFSIAYEDLTKSNISIDELRNYVIYVHGEFLKNVDQVLQHCQNENYEMATVLGQISHIISIEGKAHIELLNETLFTAREKLTNDIKNDYETSAVPIAHTGDTPQPLERTRNLTERSRNSLIRTLFPKPIPKDHPELQ